MPKRAAATAADPDPIDVDLVLADYNETYLVCRDLMHAWRPLGWYRKVGWSGAGNTHRLLVCDRCGMERDDRWDGAETRHSYAQPDGYHVEGVRISKADVRAEQLRRAKRIFDSEDAMRKNLAQRQRRQLKAVGS